MDFTNIEHKAAVDAIRKAGRRIVFTVERKSAAPVPETREFSQPTVEPVGVPTVTMNIGENVPPLPERPPPSLFEERTITPTFETGSGYIPPSSPSPHLVFPCPKPYKATGASSGSLIPSEKKAPSAIVTVTVKQPDTISKVPDVFQPTPTDLGTITETITKSTNTETVFTRVTHNEPVMVPVATEVSSKYLGDPLTFLNSEAWFCIKRFFYY